MTSIIEKRCSLHKELASQQSQNNALKSQIAHLQALANIGTSTSMIAHEINNLLTPLANYAALALNNPDDKLLAKKALQKAVRNCTQASKITESILAVSNSRNQTRQEACLLGLVKEIFSCLARDFSKDGITVKIQIPEDLTIWAVPVQIQQALMNLIINARQAILPNNGILTIKAHETADAVQIEVSDTGCGIKHDDLKNLFEPFYTTKTDRASSSEKSGGGLGLAFCKKMVDAHQGCITVESELSKGSMFRITLPKANKNRNAKFG